MKCVHYRRTQPSREADCGRVEGVIVDNVVSRLTYRCVDAGKRRLRHAQPVTRAPRCSVQRGGQRVGVNPRVDHLDARYLRSGRGIDPDLVASVHQTTRQIGQERL